jgi:hypothetical protein
MDESFATAVEELAAISPFFNQQVNCIPTLSPGFKRSVSDAETKRTLDKNTAAVMIWSRNHILTLFHNPLALPFALNGFD